MNIHSNVNKYSYFYFIKLELLEVLNDILIRKSFFNLKQVFSH
jgi:hypothetical protein